MRHLSPEELLDLAEGARPFEADRSHSHLSSCEACRQQLAQLRAIMNAVSDVEVPEPSPLFWEHLSARVHDGVAAGEPARRSRWSLRSGPNGFAGLGIGPWRFIAPVAAAAVAIVAVVAVVSLPRQWSAPPMSSPSAGIATGSANVESSADTLVDDPAFSLVSDLTAGIDVETALEAGLASQGSADEAVNHLNSSELGELERLLKEEMARTQS